MKKKTLIISFLIVLCLLGNIQAGKFQKIVYWDPYSAMMAGRHGYGGDTTGLAPEQYIDQIDEFGATLAYGIADSLGTHYAANNNLDVQFWGQDYNLKLKGYNFNDLIRFGFVGHAEAELDDNDEYGYDWTYSQGNDLFEGPDVIGKLYDPNQHSADTVLKLSGAKFINRRNSHMYPYFVMKAWDTLTTDTICDVSMYYWDYDPVAETWNNLSKTYHYRGIDFQNPDSSGWSIFKEPATYSESSGWASVSFRVYWRGNDSLAVDNISCRSYYGLILEQAAADNVTDDSIKIAIANYYSRINTDNHGRFSPEDEPRVSQFWGMNLWDDNADTVVHKRVTSSVNYSLGIYINEVDPLEVIPNHYSFWPYHDSSSNTGIDTTSIQNAYDDFIEHASFMNSEIVSRGKDYWQILQAGGYADADTAYQKRDPTTFELKNQCNLAVTYGASGVGYFTYISTKEDLVNGFSFNNSDEKFELFPLSSGSSIDPWVYHGLVAWDYDSLKHIPNERWYAAKEWNEFIDSIWITLDSLTWEDADNWKNVKSITGSVIDSIYSTDFVDTSTYLEVGRFTSVTNEEYYTLVNRRSLSSDSQDVVIQFDNRPGYTKVTDVYTGEVFDVYDSLGTAKLSLHFDPAEMKLIKVEDNITEFSGAWNGTWPTYSTINITGDITVDSGQTLIINSKYIDVVGFADATSGGNDVNKTEILVNGELRIEGTATNRIVLAPDTTANESWKGIRVNNSMDFPRKNGHGVKYVLSSLQIELDFCILSSNDDGYGYKTIQYTQIS